MASMRTAVALALASALLLAGCADPSTFTAAVIPQEDLASGWSQDPERTGQDTVNVGPFTVAVVSKQVYEQSDMPRGVIAVVSVTDVPLAGVQDRIRTQFGETLQSQGVERTERESGQLTVDGRTADYTLYDAEMDAEGGARASGLVLEYTYTCDAEGTVVGFLGLARTEVQTAFGTSRNEQTWQEIAGSNWESEFGGMSKDIVCSP